MRRYAPGVAVALVFAVASPSVGQVRVNLTGQVESMASVDTRRTRDASSQTLGWGSRYTPNLDGFIWHPRFMTYSLGGTLADHTTRAPEGTLGLLQTEPYRLNLSFFPEAPHTFNVRAGRTIVDTDFDPVDGRTDTSRITTSNEALMWLYRGSSRFPSGSVELLRERTTAETDDGTLSDSGVMAATLQTSKSFTWMNPMLRYRIEMRDSETAGGTEPTSEIGHTMEYNDRIRLGPRLLMSPNVTYRINPAGEGVASTVNTALPLAAPLTPTVDGTAEVRYQFAQGEELQHTFSTNGGLTKRFSPDLALSGGLNGVVITGQEEPTWSTGAFTSLTANPRSHLRTLTNYFFQLNGMSGTTAHRGQLSATSTVVPAHVFTGSYFLNVTEAPAGGEQLLTQSWQLAASSSAIPRTTLDGNYAFQMDQGYGDHVTQSGAVGATHRVGDRLSLQGGADYADTSSRGAGRVTTGETRYGVRAAFDVAAFYWLTVSASGGLGLVDTVREDRSGRFVNDRGSVGFTVGWRTLQLRADGFHEREAMDERTYRGVRGQLSYRFRIWTLTLDLQQTVLTTRTDENDHQRVFFRLVRPLSTFASWPFSVFRSSP